MPADKGGLKVSRINHPEYVVSLISTSRQGFFHSLHPRGRVEELKMLIEWDSQGTQINLLLLSPFNLNVDDNPNGHEFNTQIICQTYGSKNYQIQFNLKNE